MKQRYFKIAGTSMELPRLIISSTIDDILKYAKPKLVSQIKNYHVLDVGSGYGDYSQMIARKVKKVVGVEPYKDAFDQANKRNNKKNVRYFNLPVEKFNSKIKFDLALSLTTLEHMPNAYKSYEKVFQLLKPGGVLYLSAPNKLWPIESHYSLPFLSWLPLRIANLYLKIFRKVNSYEDCSYSLTYFGLRKLLNRLPCKYEFLVPAENSAYLGCGGQNNLIIQKLGIFLIKKFSFFWFFSKGFIVVAQKL